MNEKPRFKYVADGAYDIVVAGTVVGTVTRRRGGYWRCSLDDGRHSGSFCTARKEAVAEAFRQDPPQ